MRYEVPAIENRVPIQALMTVAVGSPVGQISPLWRSRAKDDDAPTDGTDG